MPWTLPPSSAFAASSRPAASVAEPERGDQQHREGEAEHDRRQPLPAHRLDERVGRVDADDHQHEQEQHHDRAGVDDDLGHAEERRLLRDVEHREAIIVEARNSALCTALRDSTIPSAPSDRDEAQTQNTNASPALPVVVDAASVLTPVTVLGAGRSTVPVGAPRPRPICAGRRLRHLAG